ncbi:MAG: PDZ domain-containing protein [bacterium]|nr:PDZ domain-containing protein [bacterium]
MKCFARIVAALALSGLVGVAYAGGEHKCTAETQDCLNWMVANYENRGWIGIEIEEDEESGALVITNVFENSPGEEAGLERGDVLIAVDGLKFCAENKEKIYKSRKEWVPGKTIRYTVERGGCCHTAADEKQIEIVLGKLPDRILAEWIGRHMLEHAVEIAEKE